MTTHHLDRALVLTTGAVAFESGQRFTDPIGPGLKIVSILSGRTTLQIGRAEAATIVGPAVLTIGSDAATSRSQSFEPAVLYRYALVDVAPAFVEGEFGVDPRGLFPGHDGSAALAVRPADAAMQALTGQLVSPPNPSRSGAMRLPKALELVALALQDLVPGSTAPAPIRLPATDVSRIRAARDILVADIDAPPDVGVLAARVGLNVRKLTSGFRAVYGETPYAYLQEHRLQTAYRLLVAGDRAVGEVAHAVGYGATHLSTLFARRFGVSPRALRGRDAAASTSDPFWNGPNLLRSK